jgi:hypothetical protein
MYRTMNSPSIRAAFYGIIDLLAILPYYIEIAAQQDTVRHIMNS